MKIKRIAVLLCAVLILTLTLAACDKGGKNVIGIIPAYMGGDITVTDYEFTKDDFFVLANYEDGTDASVTDYTIASVKLDQGYYVIRIEYEGVGNNCYVKCRVPVYPSDFETTGEPEHNH